MIVGCLPPFKSLFKGHRSFQRCKSPVYKSLSPGLRLDAIRLGSAEAGATAEAAPKVISRPTNREKDVFDGGFGGGYNVPRGAIGVRSDYVSCKPGVWIKS